METPRRGFCFILLDFAVAKPTDRKPHMLVIPEADGALLSSLADSIDYVVF